ncbi:hypothetical protein Fmac_021474 [Flemingia macrophylla]|uniref:DUF659 domain-containing protein n=1 Tax=Flemingia macrophylla TaxID=520843 RepID=A0ABD1LWY7_9FABA
MDGKKHKQNEAFNKAIQDLEVANAKDLWKLEVLGDFRLKDTRKGPMDLNLYTKPQSTNAKNRKDKVVQAGIREVCDKKATERVYQSIARFWYQAGLSFNLIKLESFHDMLHEVAHFGKHLKPPSYHDIRVPLLQKEVEYTNELMKPLKEQWTSFGCSIMSNGWTDRKQRSIINFLVNSSSGTMFLKSVDASDYVKTGEKIFELLDSIVDEIGEENVVQVITDNGSNYVLAGRLLEEKRKKIYWTPCAAHCIDLMLEDIGKMPNIKKTIQRAISLVGFIYNHTSTLSMLRFFTGGRELVRHAITRFATSYLSLERIHQEKTNIRKMFVSEEWNENKLSKDAKGKEVTKTVLMPSFWKNVVYILKVMAPLVKVLRLVDSEKKPVMGYIYEAMDKAKETIMKSFKNESKYKDVFAIIDKRWDIQLHRPLHAAGHFLNPEFFYANPQMEFNGEIIRGLYDCINKLLGYLEMEKTVHKELAHYKAASGMFGSTTAKAMRGEVAPDKRQNISTFSHLLKCLCLIYFVCICSSMVADVWFRYSLFATTCNKDP